MRAESSRPLSIRRSAGTPDTDTHEKSKYEANCRLREAFCGTCLAAARRESVQSLIVWC
jgi:hypothetical protein